MLYLSIYCCCEGTSHPHTSDKLSIKMKLCHNGTNYSHDKHKNTVKIALPGWTVQVLFSHKLDQLTTNTKDTKINDLKTFRPNWC